MDDFGDLIEFDREDPTSEQLLKRKSLKEYLGELESTEQENPSTSSKMNDPKRTTTFESVPNTRTSHKSLSSPPDMDPNSRNDDNSIISNREDEFYEDVRASKQSKRANREAYHK